MSIFHPMLCRFKCSPRICCFLLLFASCFPPKSFALCFCFVCPLFLSHLVLEIYGVPYLFFSILSIITSNICCSGNREERKKKVKEKKKRNVHILTSPLEMRVQYILRWRAVCLLSVVETRDGMVSRRETTGLETLLRYALGHVSLISQCCLCKS
ncbi:hypothetical protein F5I97DRAFT_1505292 [Phlebopus sp. FC_14]|nr:hypothetical protein F5I97DRAFT_1505292 [Phlebopus sp. FC_14]